MREAVESAIEATVVKHGVTITTGTTVIGWLAPVEAVLQVVALVVSVAVGICSLWFMRFRAKKMNRDDEEKRQKLEGANDAR